MAVVLTSTLANAIRTADKLAHKLPEGDHDVRVLRLQLRLLYVAALARQSGSIIIKRRKDWATLKRAQRARRKAQEALAPGPE